MLERIEGDVAAASEAGGAAAARAVEIPASAVLRRRQVHSWAAAYRSIDAGNNPMSQIRVAIAGASGRMGRMLIEAALKEGVVLAAAFDRSGTLHRLSRCRRDGRRATGVLITDDAAAAIARPIA